MKSSTTISCDTSFFWRSIPYHRISNTIDHSEQSPSLPPQQSITIRPSDFSSSVRLYPLASTQRVDDELVDAKRYDTVGRAREKTDTNHFKNLGGIEMLLSREGAKAETTNRPIITDCETRKILRESFPCISSCFFPFGVW